MRFLIASAVAPARTLWLLAVLAASCRPAGYEPTPKNPDEAPTRIPLPDAERLAGSDLIHSAMLGMDVATPSVMTPPDDAEISQTGLVTKILHAGVGQRTPRPSETVVMHFTGWTAKGDRFDSTVARGAPDRYRVETLVDGWREGVQMMVVGEKRRMWIPERMAFGAVPAPGRPAGDIVLDVELIDIIEAPKAPEASDLATPPADARQTASGLKYQILTPGTGEVHPQPADRVLVHYSGWNTQGEMFDSSVSRGEPLGVGVTEVIRGWTEMLQLMVEGERVRVWIPANLAYGETPSRPGAPAGDLVFEIELLEIQ